MFDYKQLFGFAAILFGIGFILQSIMPARAISMGPSVSMGSNPVFAVQASGQSGTLFTNNTSSPAIITDLFVLDNSYCYMTFSVSNSGDQFRAGLELPHDGCIQPGFPYPEVQRWFLVSGSLPCPVAWNQSIRPYPGLPCTFHP